MNEAYFLKRGTHRHNSAPRVDWSIYCMSPPYGNALFCRVSTVHQNGGETLIFNCDDSGKIENLEELYRVNAIINHSDALIAIGYQVRNP